MKEGINDWGLMYNIDSSTKEEQNYVHMKEKVLL